MLTARLFANRTTRFVAFSIIVAAVFVVADSFTTGTFACPGPPPQPLRALYIDSDLIVIARIGKTEITKVEKGEDEFELSSLKTALLVSSTLKGEPQPVVYVNRLTYGEYRDQLSSATEGETFLVFLTRHGEDEGYDIDNMSFGLKQLSEADLKVYVSRIEELASIMKADKPDPKEIVDWLVRCSEDPATRWEGTYDLAVNNYMRQAQEDQTNENAPSDSLVEVSENQAAETPVEEISPSDVENQNLRIRDAALVEANFLKLLTTEQKDRLTTALINGEIITDRDYYLIDIVRTWDDPRLVPYLLSQLRQIDEASSYYAENLMTIIAEKLGDETLKRIVEKLNAYDYVDAETTADGDAGDQDAETTARDAQREAAVEEAALQKRKTTVQYFIAMAENTAPNPVPKEHVDAPVPTEP